MAIMEIGIVPLGTKTPSVSKYIAKAVKEIEKSKLKYQLCPMGTIIEGDVDSLLKLALKMHNSVFSKEIKRVVTTIKIDDRRDKTHNMEKKIKSVKEKLKRIK